jgi:hypothetical protein
VGSQKPELRLRRCAVPTLRGWLSPLGRLTLLCLLCSLSRLRRLLRLNRLSLLPTSCRLAALRLLPTKDTTNSAADAPNRLTEPLANAPDRLAEPLAKTTNCLTNAVCQAAQ